MVSRHQIKKAIKVLELACAEDFADVKNELSTALLSVKQQIEELEHAINRLKSNDLDFECQIEIYQDTLKKVSELNNIMKKLTQKIKHAEIPTNES